MRLFIKTYDMGTAGPIIVPMKIFGPNENFEIKDNSKNFDIDFAIEDEYV